MNSWIPRIVKDDVESLHPPALAIPPSPQIARTVRHQEQEIRAKWDRASRAAVEIASEAASNVVRHRTRVGSTDETPPTEQQRGAEPLEVEHPVEVRVVAQHAPRDVVVEERLEPSLIRVAVVRAAHEQAGHE